MESDKLTIAILAVVGALLYFGLSFKKRKEAEMNERFLRMEKEGDFKGMKQMFGRLAIIWSVIAFLILAISAVRLFSDGISAVLGLIFGAVLVWRDYEIIRKWRAYKKLEERISYRLSDKEVEEFWLQDNDAIYEGLYDYLFKKSYLGSCPELLNDKEMMIYVLTKLDFEVGNGGFSQFFLNTEGKFNKDIVRYATEVGAHDIAKICDKALGIINGNLSEDETEVLLNDECDEAFFASEDYLNNLCADYARNHKDSFLS